MGAAALVTAKADPAGPVSPGMMGQAHGMGPGMMGQGMDPDQWRWMMGQGYGSRMMSPEAHEEMLEHMGNMPGHPGAACCGGLAGTRVTPTMQLSIEDVRVFFERQLAAEGNKRLKVGKVEVLDDHTIAAQIVTVDDSLVESYEVDRHTGVVSPAG